MNLSAVETFGGTDADNDPVLLDCFEDHPAYADVLQHRRFCVLGRKGSGKTAIFKKILLTREYDQFAFGHTFNDYPWHYHDRQKQLGVPEESCFMNSWMYLCLITIAKILLNYDSSQPYNEGAADYLTSVESFVVDTYGSRDPDVTQIFSPQHKLQLSGRAGFNLPAVSVEGNVSQIPIEYLPTYFSEINNSLSTKILNSLNQKLNYYVLFDQLDLGFTKLDPNYRLRLIGLLLAARAINIKAKELGKKLNVVTFLRHDIYDWLQFEDKNKITENFSTSILWDIGIDSRTLKSLMERRFSVALEGATRWEDVFDDAQDMPGRQKKYKYLLDRTFLRPRDMIKFSNEILASYKTNTHEGAGKFINSDLYQAEPRYSDYLYREIDDEIHKHIPDYKTYLDMLKGLESLQFDLDDFFGVWESRKHLLAAGSEPKAALRDLFEFSIIGFYSAGGGGGGAEYVWRYRDPRIYFNEFSY